MREDEEQFRHYMPVLRRVVILAAIITAVPVTMWTARALVRTYLGSHKAQAVQSPAASPSSQVAAAGSDSTATLPPATMQANPGDGGAAAAQPADTSASAAASATTPDATAAAPSNSVVADASAEVPTGSAASPAGGAPNPANVASVNPAADGSAVDPASGTESTSAADGATQTAARQSSDTVWPTPPAASAPSAAPATDASPSEQPISGPVPLPHRRPRSFVLAQAGIPLPRPRPDAAGVGAAAPQATPMGWLHNIFHSSSGTDATAVDPPNSGGNEETPH
ncbi:MAG: hypothetical protein WBF58_09445 [Xanthobacteraceae bacterium]